MCSRLSRNGQRRLTMLAGWLCRGKKVVASWLGKGPMQHADRPRIHAPMRTALAVACLVVSILLGLAGAVRADREHTVSKGQTLSRIASKYGVAVSSLAAANGLSDQQQLREGQVLLVPSRGVVYVSAGDTLAG